MRYPDALRPAFPRLKEKLEDPDPGVQVGNQIKKQNYSILKICPYAKPVHITAATSYLFPYQ